MCTPNLKNCLVPWLFFSIVGANILSMSVMSFFETEVSLLPVVYLLCLFMSFFLVKRSKIDFPVITRKHHWMALAFGFFLTLPRLPYLLEPILGYSVGAACWDDWWHIQEFASIIYSGNFPPKETFTNNKFLSFYYSSLMLGSALFSSSLFVTVKQAIFISYLVYNVLFSYMVFYAANIIYVGSSRQRNFFILLVVFYGGFDFFYGITFFIYELIASGEIVFKHAEWWAHAFGLHVQFPSFFTLALWVPHHLMSAAALFFGIYCLLKNQVSLTSAVIAGISFAFALFSSVFVTIGALPVVLYFMFSYRVARANVMLCAATGGIVSVPVIWMYLGRGGDGFVMFVSGIAVFERYRILGFMVFLLIMLLEFLPIVYGIVSRYSRGLGGSGLFFAAFAVMLSTFFVSYHGTGNYAMRASIVPMLVMVYLAVPAVVGALELSQSKFIAVLALSPFLLGGIWEYFSFSQSALSSARKVSDFQKNAYLSNSAKYNYVEGAVEKEAYNHEFGWYMLENRKTIPKRDIAHQDKELMCSDNRFRITYDKIKILLK